MRSSSKSSITAVTQGTPGPDDSARCREAEFRAAIRREHFAKAVIEQLLRIARAIARLIRINIKPANCRDKLLQVPDVFSHHHALHVERLRSKDGIRI